MDNPEGRLLTLQKQDGRATYRLWCMECTLRFYLCSFIIAWKCRKRLKILLCEFDMPAS